jgi:iron complex outermembrane recepter protein
MKNLLFIAFFVFFIANIQNTFAQNAAKAPIKGTVKGTVKDNEKKPLPFANVALHKAADSVLVKVVVTEDNGTYEFENLAANSYYVAISYIGFKKYKSEKIELATNQNFQVPDIELVSSENLAEVTVTYRKPFAEKKIDRVVINPDALIGNAGTTALEVLEKSPGVQVELDGSLKLKGKNGVVVFVDDKPTYMSADALASFLRSLPSSSIESIEIMTNPPAKYDAAGNAGVINIRLKKTTLRGWNGGINLAAGQGFYSRTNNSANLNYRINKFNFFGNLSYNVNNNYQDLVIERNYLRADGTTNASFRQNTFIKKEQNSGTFRLGLDYYVSKKTTMGFVVNGFYNPSLQNLPNKAVIKNGAGQIDSLMNTLSIKDEKLKNGTANFNINHKFDSTGREITANFDYIRYDVDTKQTLDNRILFADGQPKTKDALRGNLPSNIEIRTAKIDYSNPLKSGGLIEAGVKTSFVKTDNTALFYNEKNGISTPSKDLTNSFRYSENINAAYLNFNREFGKLSLQSGLRLENTNIDGLQYGSINNKKDSTFQRNYTSLFPTIYLAYKLDTTDTHQIGFSYGRRIDRPNYQDMNPFSYPWDRFTIYAGNPFLRPTYSNNFELTHTFKNKITTTLSYSLTNDMISESIEISNKIFYSRPNNIGKQTTFGISVNGTINPTKWWTIPFYVEVTNMKFESIIYEQRLDNQGTFFVTDVSSQFQMGKGWSSEIGLHYQTAVYYTQFITIPVWRARMGVQKKILKDKGSLKLNLSDAFFSFQPGGNILALANANARFYSVLDTRVLTLSFSWRFSQGQVLQNRKSGGSDDERSRVKGG